MLPEINSPEAQALRERIGAQAKIDAGITRKWVQTTVDKLQVFNVFQLGFRVYVITRRSVAFDGTIILEVTDVNTGQTSKQTWIWPDSLVEYVVFL